MKTENHKAKLGRKPGSIGLPTLRKRALKTLQSALDDETAPIEVKVSAAKALLQEIPPCS